MGAGGLAAAPTAGTHSALARRHPQQPGTTPLHLAPHPGPAGWTCRTPVPRHHPPLLQAPRKMRTELWLSSLQRKGVGVAAAEQYDDMLRAVGCPRRRRLLLQRTAAAPGGARGALASCLTAGSAGVVQQQGSWGMWGGAAASTVLPWTAVSLRCPSHPSPPLRTPPPPSQHLRSRHNADPTSQPPRCAQPIGDEAAQDIEKDLSRTFPTTKRFYSAEGQAALRRVLRAYAAFDPEVGPGPA